jgi:hypothetical protein
MMWCSVSPRVANAVDVRVGAQRLDQVDDRRQALAGTDELHVLGAHADRDGVTRAL